jgi:MFS family permease
MVLSCGEEPCGWQSCPLSHYADRYDQDVSGCADGGDTGERGTRRWLVLAAGTVAVTAGCAFQYGLAYLIPALRASGLSLAQAGVIVACPTAGLLLTLVAWGAAADRWGERRILAAGLGIAGLVLLAAARARGIAALAACLVVAGAAGASVHAASGRLILGWFAARERGLAMGVRQSAQPLGVAVAALTLPSLAAGGTAAALAFLGGFCLVADVLVVAVVRDPARAGERARAQRGCGGSTPRARCWSCRSSRWPPSRSSSWSTRGAGPRQRPGRCWRSRPLAGPRPGWGPGTGRTGWAAGCGRCGCSR